MINDCVTVWRECLNIIKNEISTQSFHTWFMPIKPVKLENNVLTIAVPSPFFYEWLEEYYVHVLKKAIDAVLGPNGKLEYSIMVSRRPKNAPFTVQRRQQPAPNNAGGYDPYGNNYNDPYGQQQNPPSHNPSQGQQQYNTGGYPPQQQTPSPSPQYPNNPVNQEPNVPKQSSNIPPYTNPPSTPPQQQDNPFGRSNEGRENIDGQNPFGNDAFGANQATTDPRNPMRGNEPEQSMPKPSQSWREASNQNTAFPSESKSENLGGTQSNRYQNPPQYRKSQSQQLPQYRSSSAPKNNPEEQQRPYMNNMGAENPSGFVDHFRVPNAQESSYRDSYLNPTYTFETFIEGDCNRLARSASIAIARRPGETAFNPLVVYGGVGLGKTHLAQAVGNEVKRNDPSKFVLYVTSEQFTTQFIEALRNNNVQQFTNYYLQVDVLIVDDIQFLAKKEKTQENFFHIFNRLHQNGKQIIMTTDRPPRSLEGLTDRLLSRFKWGLTADIQKPDFETRIAIVKQKLMAEGVNVPDDVVEYLSYNIDSNIRELEGTLVSLLANASLMQKEIDLDMAKNALLNIVRNTEKEITIDFIQQIVSEYFGISVEELKSKTRKKDIAQARQIAMYFSKEYTKEPLKTIGNQFGGRDHSTVVHASKAVTKRTASDSLYNRILEELLDQMNIKSKG
ncbi:chromosomal replication initiator protein DnaA [Flammeovirga sp. SJP92]|uniref:chromosomal replication initiator protein DnaA n=1 Tax=Flammeovirga sp. SJP92 TaxID=1775430 RepID=UPI0009EE0ECF